jgi:hypothetical protein
MCGIQGLVAGNGDTVIYFLREQFLSSGSDISRSTEADVKSVCADCVVRSKVAVHVTGQGMLALAGYRFTIDLFLP